MREVLTPNLLLTSAGDDDSTFDTDTGNWTKGTGWSIGSGVASASSAANFAYLNVFTLNKWYALTFYISAYTSGTLYAGTPTTNEPFNSTGWKTTYFRADSTGLYFLGLNTFTGSIDNVIVQEVPASVARAFYLDFDGLDDNLILPGTDFGSSTNATLYKTFRGDSTDTSQMMFASNGWPFILAANSGSTSGAIKTGAGTPVYREDGAIASYATRGDVFTALVDNTDHTIGVEEADLASNVTWASDGFYIGGEYDGTWDSTGRLYSWAAVDTRLDGRNRALLENFMISRKTT